jgi:hypothetical protein
MRITRERFLDDSRIWALSLELVSRTPEMHSTLDAMSPSDREAVGDLIVEALGRIARIVEPYAVERGARPVRVTTP